MAKVSRRTFVAGGALAALGGSMALVGCAPGKSGSKGSSAAGRVAGSGAAVGRGGHLEVEAVLEDGKLLHVNNLKSRESEGVGTAAMDQIAQLAVEHQTLNIDAVSGATLTSMAYLSALSQALDQAGEKSSSWKKRDKASPQLPADLPSRFDVVVVGAGGAGYAAALTAARAGKSVALLEKLGITGGDTILSGGAISVPGNYFQRRDGIDDSAEKLAEDMLVGGDNLGDPDLVRVIAEGAYDAMEWLTFEADAAWQPYQQFFGGHSVPRSLIPYGQEGSELIVKLDARGAELPNLTVLRNMKAEELLMEGASVTGVRATHAIDGSEHRFTAKAVVLTTGGFGSNVEMRVKYNPEMDESILSTDSVGATGDGIVMAEKIGANLIDMQYIQTYPTCDTETGALLYTGNMRLNMNAICINKEGKRFVEELERRDVISNAVKKQTDGIGYMLFNQKQVDATGVFRANESEVDNLTARKKLVKADTLAEACEPFGIDAAALQKTVEAWNRYCAEGKDPEFNYRSKLNPIEGGPYYVLAYKPSVHYTMGGLHINVDAQVLDTAGSPIPGLYAAGEQAGHKMGNNRLGSCSIADIFVFGRIAGANAAKHAE
ncbi:flavocytochrome c [Eggerthellaceae bacterium zg-1084]|uniref:flavocytochrome c n=1 Tax=Berryella wangjianweii TaxID=2734634 RepID=UPI0015542025|nr:flavocytochrome c [Berryella wangjianweii]NPD31268.1 flavocytochrome c [Berryella wangjianweii]NPD32423.1 flavocytochrome c [Eggerthellaceae bacterium zg-997]